MTAETSCMISDFRKLIPASHIRRMGEYSRPLAKYRLPGSDSGHHAGALRVAFSRRIHTFNIDGKPRSEFCQFTYGQELAQSGR